jgi:hypothetical protein
LPGILADLTFATHAVFVIVAIPSTILALAGVYRKLPLAWLVHSGSMLIMASGTLAFGRCPLVELEDTFRTAADESMPYTGSFVSYCLQSLVGVPMPAGSMLYISSSIAVLSLVAILIHGPLRIQWRRADDGTAARALEQATTA